MTFLQRAKLILEKLETFALDRRQASVGLFILIVQWAFPHLEATLSAQASGAFGDVYGAAAGVITALLLVAVKLIIFGNLWGLVIRSWTTRPPSGLDFKRLVGYVGVGTPGVSNTR